MIKARIITLLLLGLCSCTALFGEPVTVEVDVSPTVVPAGTAPSLTVRVTGSVTGTPVASGTGNCKILNSQAQQVAGGIFFLTDSNGYAFPTVPSLFQLDTYTVECTSDLVLGPPGYDSGTGFDTYEVIAGACSGTDATTVVTNNSPYSITWHFDLDLVPNQATSGNGGFNETGFGVDGHPQSTYDCSGNVLSTSAAPPTYELISILPRNDNGLDAFWVISNYQYLDGQGCSSGYCNGYQSLNTQPEADGHVNLTFYCY